VSPVKYEQGFYIPEDILHSHRRENMKTYITTKQVSDVQKQELGSFTSSNRG
jgi:hypothetical protein